MKKGSLNMKNSVSLLKKIFSGISVIGALIHSGYAEDLVITFTNGQTEGIPWDSEILGGASGTPWGPWAPEGTPNKEIKDSSGLFYRNRISHVVIPSNVKIIGAEAFEDCGLESIEIPSSVTTVEVGAFSDCINLQTVIFKGGNSTIIGPEAFAFCPNLKSVTIPNGVIKISNRAFENCIGLESIVIPSTVTTIEFEAFMGCSNLRNVTFNGTTPSIGSAVFLGCKSLESVVGFDGEALALPRHAFFGCKLWAGIYELPYGPTVEIKACLLDSEVMHKLNFSVPEACIGACPIRLLILEKALEKAFNDPSLFSQYEVLSDIGIFLSEVNEFEFCPDDLERYWDQLMGRFSQLIASIEIFGNIETLCGQSFKACGQLTSIEIPSSVTTIGERAFWRSGLTSIIIPSSVTTIGAEAFAECSGLTTITLPQGLTSIGEGAFADCSGLTTITLPQGLTSIGEEAFAECRSLTSVEIPSRVTTIKDGAFRDCSGLATITLPQGLTSIGEEAFAKCENLKLIEIPSSVTSIGEDAFLGCSGLESIILPSGVIQQGLRYIGIDENNGEISIDSY